MKTDPTRRRVLGRVIEQVPPFASPTEAADFLQALSVAVGKLYLAGADEVVERPAADLAARLRQASLLLRPRSPK